jgi:hypothetical protein
MAVTVTQDDLDAMQRRWMAGQRSVRLANGTEVTYDTNEALYIAWQRAKGILEGEQESTAKTGGIIISRTLTGNL